MKRVLTMLVGFAGLVAFCVVPNLARGAGTVKPVTGVGSVTVTGAANCPNVSCESGTVKCSFILVNGAAQTYTSFGTGLGKATLLACIAINQDNAVSVGSGASGDTTCAPATGTALFTGSSKAAPQLTLAFAGQACTLPTAPTKQVLRGGYIIQLSTDKSITNGEGQMNLGWDTVTHAGGIAFSGNRNF